MSDTASSQPRIAPLSIEEAKACASEFDMPEPLATLNVFRVLLRQPRLAKALTEPLLVLMLGSSLDPVLRELVILRLGWRYRSAYEWAQHWRIASDMGIPEEKLLATRHGPDAPGLSPAERAVLEATDDVIDTGCVSAETWAGCREHVGGDVELIELVAAIANWRSFATLLTTLEIPLESDLARWPPDGKEPPAG